MLHDESNEVRPAKGCFNYFSQQTRRLQRLQAILKRSGPSSLLEIICLVEESETEM